MKTFYEITGKINDINTLLVNKREYDSLVAVARQALEALELIANAENSALDLAYCKGIARAAIAKVEDKARAAISALREALCHPQQDLDPAARIPLYTTPQPTRQPLSALPDGDIVS